MSLVQQLPPSAKSNVSRLPLMSTKSNSTRVSLPSADNSFKISKSPSTNSLKQTPSSANSLKEKTSSTIRLTKSCGSLFKNSFGCSYTAACTKYKTRPAQGVRINSGANSIEVWGDRLRCPDWQAAMETLSADIDTHHVCIKNRRNQDNNSLKNYETLSSVLKAPKTVVASCTLFVVHLIANSVYDVLVNSHVLVCLELQNILFDDQALEILFSGIKASHTLQHLSLSHCRIGDAACLNLCRVLRDKPNIRSIDLSGCSLSSVATTNGLVEIVKKQQVRRNEECWTHSLRYRSANPDIMHGLRRLTLNDNTGLGDDGVIDLFEVLKDDLFIKAIDLQNCGLTDRSGRVALSMLLINDTLVLLDVRNNDVISAAVLEFIMARLHQNNVSNSETEEWKWTKLWRENMQVESSSVLSVISRKSSKTNTPIE
ncbi:Leucine-rich repeat,Leucine-rich repeat, cysteine-containing subtype,Centrosomal protein of 78kDa [Cinara cedri]|uniref:Leucine-rich repeat,Leucine-rich repeat, cysteine-containing subtype,Centrosomal protein of 78kDa n=1 Tax=Cinara cedri TaxID=506608 RepID=A0A5E4MQT8_9HEMI|nr:Leucine-rich repeat,Leucine-rich repeat, cysteine-containing subtype,Centrosomal protein of 78kDa [Cinara cedri]